ncbi:hypothetical protein K501DRAFT_330112 [Backusella circina FSU 941]|nr:hypothetical protein K501DRAFT_330112 [Backusella circina FSU 941]
MSAEIPSWAIAVAVLFVSIIIIFSVLFIVRRRLLKRGMIGIDHQEKNIGSSQVTLNRSLSTFTSPPESPYTFTSSRSPDEKKSYFQCSTPTLVGAPPNEKAASSPLESSVTYQTLPPPSSSFFSDKMELDSDEAQALYNAYVNGVPKSNNNIQQRAVALSTNLTKSIRRKSMANLPTSIVQFFEKSEGNDMDSFSSPRPTLQQPFDAAASPLVEIAKPTNLSRMSLAKDVEDAHSTKIMIDDDDEPPYIPFSPSSPAPLCFLEEEKEEGKIDQDAAAAARKAIQSASRKSRTRSMIIADETAQAMFALIANAEAVPTLPTNRRNSVSGLLDAVQQEPPNNNNGRRRHSVMLDNHLKEIAPPPTTPYHQNNNMATIRNMLQSSWSGNNLKESASFGSLTSVEKSGSTRYMASPLGSVNNTPDKRRPSMPATFTKRQENFSSLLASRPADPPTISKYI